MLVAVFKGSTTQVSRASDYPDSSGSIRSSTSATYSLQHVVCFLGDRSRDGKLPYSGSNKEVRKTNTNEYQD